MKKALLTLALGMALTANAQINFNKKNVSTEVIIINSEYCVDGKVIYTTEMVNNKDVKFTIFNNDLSVKKTFTIHDCVVNLSEYLSIGLIPFHPISAHDTRQSYLTKNLFNMDDKFEVVKPIYKDGTIEKIEILSEDEKKLGELPIALAELYDYTINGFLLSDSENEYRYIAVRISDETYEYYQVTNGSQNSISFQKVSNSSFAFPNPVKQNSGLTISTTGMELSANSIIEVTNMNGQLVFRKEIKEGEKETSIPTRNLSSGQYIYSILSDGKIIESGKILVK